MIIKIPFEPMASPRPKFSKRGNFVQTYMPANYTQYKHDVRQFLPNVKTDCALKVEILCVMKIPKGTSKKKTAEMIGKPHTKKPDSDNLAKTYLDACNGIVWNDDNQVADLHVKKKYGIEPCVYLKITKLEE